MTDESALRVFVYDVKLCKDDGTKGSGWGCTVVTASTDPSELLRIARIVAAERAGGEQWTGLDEAKLLHVAHLDPRVAA